MSCYCGIRMGFNIRIMALESSQNAIFGLAHILCLAMSARNEIN